MRPLERSPDTRMTGSALLIDGRRLSGYQARWFRLMHPVTACTGHATSGVTALDAPDMSWLVAMARQARFINSCGCELRRVDNFIG